MIRRQLPAYSPLSGGSIAASAVGAVAAGAREQTRTRDLLAREYSADSVLLVDSGRSALQLAIEAALAERGGERIVALPAYQCYELASAAVGAGCRILLYDVDPRTLAPDPESLSRALVKGAGVAVVAPLYGVPVEWDSIAALVRQHPCTLVEDAAQGHGATWHGRPLGALGEIGVLSFGRGKGWTGGRGGALLLRGDAAGRLAPHLTQRMESLRSSSGLSEARNTLVTTMQWMAGRPSLYSVPASIPGLRLGETDYHPPGRAAMASSFAVGLVYRTLQASRAEASARHANAAHWLRALPPALRESVPRVPEGGAAGYLRFPILAPDAAVQVARSPDFLRLGIALGYPRPLSRLEPIAGLLADPGAEYPGAEQLARDLVTLPTHSMLGDADRRAILAACESFTACAPDEG